MIDNIDKKGKLKVFQKIWSQLWISMMKIIRNLKDVYVIDDKNQ